MTIINQPRTSVNIIPAQTNAESSEQRILFVAQMLDAGTATPSTLIPDVGKKGVVDTLAGGGSMAATLINANTRRNQQVKIDAIFLADNESGVAATGGFNFDGTALESGEITVIAGGERFLSYKIPVVTGDTDSDIGDKIDAAVSADADAVITSGNTAGVVVATAKNAGTYGNSIPLGIIGGIQGLTMSVTPMTGGAADPDTSTVFDLILRQRYQGVVWPYPSSVLDVVSMLTPRENTDGAVMDGVAFTAVNGSETTLSAIGNALNSKSLVIIGGSAESESGYAGGDIVEIPMVKASVFAGYRALRNDVGGFSIADLVITSGGALDSYGGPALSSKPYFNTPFIDFLPIKVGRGFSDTEIEDLLDAGITVLGNNTTGNMVVAGEVVTTYKTDAGGNPDLSFKFLNYVDTSSQIREYFAVNYKKRFAQSRLTEGDRIPGRDMANERTIRGYSKRLYQDLAALALVEAGGDAIDFFNDNLIITINKAQGRVVVQMIDPIVTQFRELQATMQIAFSTQA